MWRVRKRGANLEKVFGCDLLEHLSTSCQEIPQVLRSCSEFVEEHGIVDGIYRLSGVSSNTQKLRSEFDIDGSPDLNKDLYLQDIHCVSSLCKAYFRELPNPLLTYQLYDKFAEAVAIQLEDERLVKIRDVLKELPPLHYRTLEFLMHHLVRMASHSSKTNMHARNLAIVWAPNLLRSKDIEASGFNGTAAFMEVRVQSIVVEFILTHVPQLFPEQGIPLERRKSLPSPSPMSGQEDPFSRAVPPMVLASFGNISPGDGPLPIRPYHAIIEGTDKRKGSLKGRKWISIFNIGGRFHDPRRRNKHSHKEKDRPALRPARSMDSLSSPSYPNQGSRPRSQRTQAPTMSPLVISNSGATSESGPNFNAAGSSGYAVTYRRGTGVVSGGAGTQGTYSSLDTERVGVTGNQVQETHQTRSPGLSTKQGRRAAMHITGPHLVTVPLHITSNLALGVLQGGGGDRVIHCGRGQDGRDKEMMGKEGVETEERKHGRKAVESKAGRGAGGRAATAEAVKKDENTVENDGKEVAAIGDEGVMEEERKAEEEQVEGVVTEEEEEEEEKTDCMTMRQEVRGQGQGGEQGAKSPNSSMEEDGSDGYIKMKGTPEDDISEIKITGDNGVSEVSDILNSTELEGDDQELSGYVQDNFEFLDHMDSSIPNQMNEFSVEPPCHEDIEYEAMGGGFPQEPTETRPLQSTLRHSQPGMEMFPLNQNQNHSRPVSHRPLSADVHGRHIKSLSLPYVARSFQPAQSSSEEEVVNDEDTEDYSENDSNDEDESLFYKSLPSSYMFQNLTWSGPVGDVEDDSPLSPRRGERIESAGVEREPADQSQSSDDGEPKQLEGELSGIWEQDVETREEWLENKHPMNKEEEDKNNLEENTEEKNMQSTETMTDTSMTDVNQAPGKKDHSRGSEPAAACDFPLVINGHNIGTGTEEMAEVKTEEEEVEIPHSDTESCEGHSGNLHGETGSEVVNATCATQRDICDVSPEVSLECSDNPKEQIDMCSSEGREPDRNEGCEEKQVEEIGDVTPEKEVEEEKTGVSPEGEELKGDSEETLDEDREGTVEEDRAKPDNGNLEIEGEMFPECEDFPHGNIEYEELDNAEREDEYDSAQEDRVMTAGLSRHETEEDWTGLDDKEAEVDGILTGDINIAREIGELDGETAIPEEPRAMAWDGLRVEKIEEIGEKDSETAILEKLRSTAEQANYDPKTQQDFPEENKFAAGNSKGDVKVLGIKEEEKCGEEERGHSEEPEKGKKEEKSAMERPQPLARTVCNDSNISPTISLKREKESEVPGTKWESETGFGSALVISKQPPSKVYHVKSVPVVPPKPQHCRLTVLGFRQQQQQRKVADRERECPSSIAAERNMDQNEETEAGAEGEKAGKKETRAPKSGERRLDWDEGGTRDTHAKNSPHSMCFDEAVAIATLRRGRERESNKQTKREEGSGV